MHRTFHILTFGCQMNVNDSDWLARALHQRGFEEAPLGEATVTIINTCSVREKPELKVYSALGRVRHETRGNPGAFAVVAGCVAQQIGTGFFEKFPQVRLVTGGDGLAAAPAAIERLCNEPGLKISLVDFSESYPERAPELGGAPVPPVAYVNIMQGCDNYCAYCIVPYTRGRQKSRATTAILDECRALLEHGTKEICLLGQNVNSFGQDKTGDGTSFAALLRQVSALPGLARLRFLTPHPKDFSPEVMAAFGELENLCPRLHLPLQAGSDMVLKNMGRKYDCARFLDIVHGLRAARPDMAFSSDIIVGFPGETEDDFLATCAMLEAVGFMSSFSFCYSDRPGTRASLLPEKIPQEVKLERLARLQTRQDELGQRWLQSRQGQDTVVLLEGMSRNKPGSVNVEVSPTDVPAATNASCPDDGSGTGPSKPDILAQESEHLEHWQGRDPYGATVNVPLPQGIGHAGVLLPVRITTAKRHTLLATQAGKP